MSTAKKIGATAGALLLLLALVAYAVRRPGGGGADVPTAVAAVERRDIDVVAEAAGLIEPVRVVEVKSNAGGEVLNVLVESGDRVEEDALLAEINPRDVQSALDQAAADLDSARVQLATAEAEQARSRRLRDEGLIPPQEYEKTVEVTAAARAFLVRAEATLRLARERRRDVTITAPIAGTILERTVEPGQIISSASGNVSGGSALFRMADLSEMQVRARVDEVDIGHVQPGQPARVTVEAYPNRTFRGTVAKIEPQAIVEQNVTMFPVLVRLPNPEGLLRPGMNAEVTLEIARREDVVAVPNAAVVSLREARTAAEALGVDAAALRRDRGGEAGGSGAVGGAGQGGRGGGQAEAPAAPSASAALPAPDTAAAAACRSLLARVRAGGGPGGLSEDERARLRACRERFGGGGGGGGGRRAGGAGAAGDAGDHRSGNRQGGAAAEVETRPAVVFVQAAAGTEARRVVLGMSDWEFTEVVEGLAPGEQVVLVSVAQLQQRQQEFASRMRERMSGPLGRSGSGASRGGTTTGTGGGTRQRGN